MLPLWVLTSSNPNYSPPDFNPGCGFDPYSNSCHKR
nr:MAG TPA: hypothetical protein [Caudoviricetes sp.]